MSSPGGCPSGHDQIVHRLVTVEDDFQRTGLRLHGLDKSIVKSAVKG